MKSARCCCQNKANNRTDVQFGGSRAGNGSRRRGFFFFAGKFADGAGATGKGFQDGIAPAGCQERGDFLVDGLIGLGEEFEVLARRGCGELFYGDGEIDLYAADALFEGIQMELG